MAQGFFGCAGLAPGTGVPPSGFGCRMICTRPALSPPRAFTRSLLTSYSMRSPVKVSLTCVILALPEAMTMPVDDLNSYCEALADIVREEQRPLDEARARR